jgi:hypothetical protein
VPEGGLVEIIKSFGSRVKFYNEKSVFLVTLCFGSKISGNASLRFVEIFKKAILLHWEARNGFLPN